MTSDERVKVAKDLRKLDESGMFSREIIEQASVESLAVTMMGLISATGLCDVFGRLADLIDPTCEIMWPATPDKFGVCSACGALINMRDSVADATNYLKPRYCPNCGARVVRGDE